MESWSWWRSVLPLGEHEVLPCIMSVVSSGFSWSTVMRISLVISLSVMDDVCFIVVVLDADIHLWPSFNSSVNIGEHLLQYHEVLYVLGGACACRISIVYKGKRCYEEACLVNKDSQRYCCIGCNHKKDWHIAVEPFRAVHTWFVRHDFHVIFENYLLCYLFARGLHSR